MFIKHKKGVKFKIYRISENKFKGIKFNKRFSSIIIENVTII